MAIAAAPSVSVGPSQGGVCYSPLHGINRCWFTTTFASYEAYDMSGISFRCRNAFATSIKSHWWSTGHDPCPSKVSVAAHYSDSFPDSSSHASNLGYHPLEEVKACKRIRETELSPAEIAMTTVKANWKALLVFPGLVHSEPHDNISWAEFRYFIDDLGGIFFEIYDDENILKYPDTNTHVNALFGMDIDLKEKYRIFGEYYDDLDLGHEDLGMPYTATGSWVHPIYFAKCLTKSVQMDHSSKMDYPTNGVSIVGFLVPAYDDEESYLTRPMLCFEDDDGYTSDSLEDNIDDISDWRDGETFRFISKYGGRKRKSTLYRLDIEKIELFSVYGVQSLISFKDFRFARPDCFYNHTRAISECFSQKGIRLNVALKALCKKKGLQIERANLIGVDTLGIDVRIFSGIEVRTHRFPFKVRVDSFAGAVKQIEQLLFPPSRRKRFRKQGGGLRDPVMPSTDCSSETDQKPRCILREILQQCLSC